MSDSIIIFSDNTKMNLKGSGSMTIDEEFDIFKKECKRREKELEEKIREYLKSGNESCEQKKLFAKENSDNVSWKFKEQKRFKEKYNVIIVSLDDKPISAMTDEEKDIYFIKNFGMAYLEFLENNPLTEEEEEYFRSIGFRDD